MGPTHTTDKIEVTPAHISDTTVAFEKIHPGSHHALQSSMVLETTAREKEISEHRANRTVTQTVVLRTVQSAIPVAYSVA